MFLPILGATSLLLGRLAILVGGTQILSPVETAFQEHKVVPDVINKAPSALLNITFPNDLQVQIGNILTPTQVKDPPTVITWEADENAFYTLCLTDPDAPSRKEPTDREWNHWLVGNIPGSNLSKGDILAEWVGSGPWKETDLHRYVFLLYKQPGKLTFTEPRYTNRSGDGRSSFSIQKFADKYNMGNPIAGNMYQSEYDDYVPILYQQLGF